MLDVILSFISGAAVATIVLLRWLIRPMARQLGLEQEEALKPPKELPPMWESTDGGYSKEESQKEAGA